MRPLIIIGAGGLGSQLVERVISDPANGRHWLLKGVFDDRQEKSHALADLSTAYNFPLTHYTNIEELPIDEGACFLLGVGNPAFKEKYARQIEHSGGYFVSLLNVDNERSEASNVGESVLMKNCCIGPGTSVADYVWIDRNTIIGHGCSIGEFCHIGPNVTISGDVTVGAKTTIHSGSLIGNGVTIGDGCVIGLGSVVVRNLSDSSVVLGNPARKVADV